MDRKDRVSKKVFKRKPKGMKKYATKEYVDNLIDDAIENKFFDETIEDQIITDRNGPNAKFFQLTNIPQGDAVNERVGIRCRPKSLSLRFAYRGRNNGGINDEFTIIRLYCFQWKPSIGGPNIQGPNEADFTEPLAGIDSQTLSHLPLEFVEKYRIIFTKLIILGNDQNSSKYIDQDSFYKEFSRSQQHLLFIDGAGPTTGQIYVYLICNQGNVNTGARVSMSSRFRYEDA